MIFTNIYIYIIYIFFLFIAFFFSLFYIFSSLIQEIKVELKKKKSETQSKKIKLNYFSNKLIARNKEDK